MRCQIFLKRAANGSSNDTRDQVIDRLSDLRPDCFYNQYFLPLAHHYKSKNRNQKKLKPIEKNTQLLFNLTRT